jgi:hypothetical protein
MALLQALACAPTSRPRMVDQMVQRDAGESVVHAFPMELLHCELVLQQLSATCPWRKILRYETLCLISAWAFKRFQVCMKQLEAEGNGIPTL